jgi:hypothetical protein
LRPKSCGVRCKSRVKHGCIVLYGWDSIPILVLLFYTDTDTMLFCFVRALQHSTRGLFRNPRVGTTSSSQLRRHSGWSLALGHRYHSTLELETSPRVASLLPLCLLPWYKPVLQPSSRALGLEYEYWLEYGTGLLTHPRASTIHTLCQVDEAVVYV